MKRKNGVIALFAVACGVAVPISAQPYSEVTVHAFAPAPIACTDGMYPETSLIQASDGNLYGTTRYGGSANNGTVFRISNLETSPTETVLHCFTGGGDGSSPAAALIQASDGNLYGTAQGGGASAMGTVFRVSDLSGTPKVDVVYSFVRETDGWGPSALMQASDGNLYGTTQYGGSDGGGTVFKISDLSGNPTESVIYSFKGGMFSLTPGPDGGSPRAALIQASDGNLYGTTQGGGSGAGTVFKIGDLAGHPTESVIYSFTGGADGGNPLAPLIQASDGNLYGTTYGGGSDGAGTVFKIGDLSTSPTESVIFDRFGSGRDIESLLAPLVQASDGNLYGTTYPVGHGFGMFYIGNGTVFRVSDLATSPTGSLIYGFTASGDGHGPAASVIQASNGDLYGTAFFGGAASAGTVFEIDLGLGRGHARLNPVRPAQPAPIRPRSEDHLRP